MWSLQSRKGGSLLQNIYEIKERTFNNHILL